MSDAPAAVLPPWSAERAIANLYGPKAAARSVSATVVGNVRVTDVGKDYDTHHIVLDFGSVTFPVLEGQSIGIVPPGVDAGGRPHFPRQYSVASPRNGERPGYNNVSLTVKRVLEDHDGRPVRGVASNYLCDLKVGDAVEATGPFGLSFLMPNHPKSAIVMICTGTGSAPMRAMTEWRRRLRKSGKIEGGKLMLFFGARTKEELPYFGPLGNLPRDFIDINFTFSRTAGEPKRYVQDAMRERSSPTRTPISTSAASQQSEVYLRTAVGVDPAGWAGRWSISWSNISARTGADGQSPHPRRVQRAHARLAVVLHVHLRKTGPARGRRSGPPPRPPSGAPPRRAGLRGKGRRAPRASHADCRPCLTQ